MSKVRVNTMPDNIATTMPNAYIAQMTVPARAPKKASPKTTYTGRRAEQDMSGTSRAVRMRSRRLAMVRVAYTAGTAQPNPKIMGMKDLPCRPTTRMKRSMTKAARDM